MGKKYVIRIIFTMSNETMQYREQIPAFPNGIGEAFEQYNQEFTGIQHMIHNYPNATLGDFRILFNSFRQPQNYACFPTPGDNREYAYLYFRRNPIEYLTQERIARQATSYLEFVNYTSPRGEMNTVLAMITKVEDKTWLGLKVGMGNKNVDPSVFGNNAKAAGLLYFRNEQELAQRLSGNTQLREALFMLTNYTSQHLAWHVINRFVDRKSSHPFGILSAEL